MERRELLPLIQQAMNTDSQMSMDVAHLAGQFGFDILLDEPLEQYLRVNTSLK